MLSLDHLAFSLCEIEKLVKPLEKVIFNDAALGKYFLRYILDKELIVSVT